MSKFPLYNFPLIGKVSPVVPNNKVYILSYVIDTIYWAYLTIDTPPKIYIANTPPTIAISGQYVGQAVDSNSNLGGLLAIFDYELSNININIAAFSLTLNNIKYYLQPSPGDNYTKNSSLSTDFVNYYTANLPGLYAGFVQSFYNYNSTNEVGTIIFYNGIDGKPVQTIKGDSIQQTIFIPIIIYDTRDCKNPIMPSSSPTSYSVMTTALTNWKSGLAGQPLYTAGSDSCGNTSNLIYCYRPDATAKNQYYTCGDATVTHGCFGNCSAGGASDSSTKIFCEYVNNTAYACVKTGDDDGGGGDDDDKPFWKQLWFIILVVGLILLGGGGLLGILYLLAHKKENS